MSETHAPKQAIIRVEKVLGVPAFAIGKVRIDQLSEFDILPRPFFSERQVVRIEVHRGGKEFDVGLIRVFGEKSTEYRFSGFFASCAQATKATEETGIGDNLRAKAFQEGDELHIAVPHRHVRKNIIEVWHSQLRSSKRFSDLCEQACARRSKLMEAHRPKGGPMDILTPQQVAAYQRAWRWATKVSFAEVNKAIGKVPLPAIIHWSGDYS